MKTFTIENETNNITLHTTIRDAEAVGNAERFRNEAGLAKLAADWPATRLIDIWNSLPGATPVKKFKDRATAVNRIWKAIQSLGNAAQAEETPDPTAETPATKVVPEPADVAAQASGETAQPEPLPAEELIPVTPEPNVDTDVAPQTPEVAPEEAPAKHKATRLKRVPTAARNAPREGSKTSQVIAMLKREGGITLEEIMTVIGWQKHTTRAMLSAGGALTKNHGLTVTSEKVGEKRLYSIKA